MLGICNGRSASFSSSFSSGTADAPKDVPQTGQRVAVSLSRVPHLGQIFVLPLSGLMGSIIPLSQSFFCDAGELDTVSLLQEICGKKPASR
jgi:hypothetical protein